MLLIEKLLAMTGSSKVHERAIAIRTLGELGIPDSNVVITLLTLLKDDDVSDQEEKKEAVP